MPNPQAPKDLLRFSGLAFQMAAIIGLGAWGGKQLDLHYHTRKPYFTIALSLAAIAAALFLVIRDVTKKKS